MSDESSPFSSTTEALEEVSAPMSGCVLRVLEGPDEGKTLQLSEGSVVVGSGEGCSLQLADTAVSGRHFSVRVSKDGLVVEDLESTNGTWYLRSRLERAVLNYGSVLTVGRTKLLLSSPQPSAGPAYSDRESYGKLIGDTAAMRVLYSQLERLEKLEYTTLIQGETGVGKELIAREIHDHSKRARKPYEVCDCTALPPNLAESELFGHVKGSFTGAQSNHRGVFERAEGGTVFLDEIGELPLDLQPKLLRVLENREIRKVGAENVQPVDVRVVAATNRDLALEVDEGRFRKDLFYRLNMVTLQAPPLRDRREDIPRLVHHFVKDVDPDLKISSDTLELFTTGYDWPGNVRELRNAISRVVALGSLPPELAESVADVGEDASGFNVDTSARFQDEKKRIIESFEKDYLGAKLEQADNNISQAARSAGVERTQFKRLLRKHGLLDSNS